MIFAPLSAAYRMPRATSSSVPPVLEMLVKPANRRSQSLASTLTGISLTLKATPAVPMPSLVSWPMVPLTCVPWPSKSSGVDVSFDEIVRRDDPARHRSAPTSCGAAEYGIVTVPSAG